MTRDTCIEKLGLQSRAVSQITCTTCTAVATAPLGTVEVFYNNGWRANLLGPICPHCYTEIVDQNDSHEIHADKEPDGSVQ